ncbi:MAG: hypothetical protein HOM38_09555, partial [Euryarchaeota archaeon]|nr:hypothetical protein [Euryarchaeota archaeon]
MTTMDELRELFAGLGQQSRDDVAATNEAIRALAATVGAVVANVGAAPGAAPPVLALQSAVQTVRKSSETTVQLSLPDDQYTV